MGGGGGGGGEVSEFICMQNFGALFIHAYLLIIAISIENDNYCLFLGDKFSTKLQSMSTRGGGWSRLYLKDFSCTSCLYSYDNIFNSITAEWGRGGQGGNH